MSMFKCTYSFRLIYVFRVNDAAHEGILKVGHATLNTDLPMEQLPPNCAQLNEAARKRIKQYTQTALLQYELLHTELALRVCEGKCEQFGDKLVHKVLRNSGVEIIRHEDGGRYSDWVKTDKGTVLDAIQAVKENREGVETVTHDRNPIVLREEQEQAVAMTLKRFKKHKQMLWNAKMRFGKTICALVMVKRMAYKRTLILTHRPVVVAGWREDFHKVFVKGDGYYFGSRSEGMQLTALQKCSERYIYFASLQDLRGSSQVGGHFNKNDEVFSTEWDCVIIDEAHEGTLTKLGDQVIKALEKNETRFLRLSGTPFNLLDHYSEDSTFTWDYVKEQKAKEDWYANHIDGNNPYEDLPRLNIFTYNLNAEFSGYEDLGDKAFNFREFFRVWTGNPEQDGDSIPAGARKGDFVHEGDVMRFLKLMTRESTTTNYPFSTKDYCENFRHSFWILPGVAAAQALKALMEKRGSGFDSGLFEIVNIAGDGDEDNEDSNALKNVKTAIARCSAYGRYSITLSCGKLTTGVTVPEWTAVLMLAGSYSTSAANYLQTIFRVQSPGVVNGKQKTECYAFDFAPDRTLKMVAEAGKLNANSGGDTEEQRQYMASFLNFCPVISGEGSRMQPYDVGYMLQELKKAYVERAVRSGFDDKYIYSKALGTLDKTQLKDFDELHGIIGKTKQSKKVENIDIAVNGLNGVQRQQAVNAEKKKNQKKSLTPQEQELLDRLNAERKNKERAISILRGISIRIPLLIYGADIEYGKDISIHDLTNLVDDESWEEFMPRGITKRLFKRFIKYYDPDVFIAAGNKIRAMARSADAQPPTERIKTIAEIFSCFRNPDKETVLTPWRVVNMHMTDCLGGYDFYDAAHENILDTPRIVMEPNVTPKTFLNPDARILELNAKTGLYSLFATYNIMRARVCKQRFQNRAVEQRCWNDALKENIFILCKTKMGCSIVRRTLAGYTNAHVNVVAFHDILDVLKNRRQLFISRVSRPSFYSSSNNSLRMKFNAVIGNPPYQEMDGGSNSSATPVYNLFVEAAKQMNPDFISLIMPARWYVGGKGLDEFRENMLTDDRLVSLYDYPETSDCFPNVNIRGGVCYFLWDAQHHGESKIFNYQHGRLHSVMQRPLLEEGAESFIRYNEAINILRKVQSFGEPTMFDLVSSRKPYGLPTNFSAYAKSATHDKTLKIYMRGGSGFAARNVVTALHDTLDRIKVIVAKASPGADDYPHLVFSEPIIAEPNSACTETYIVVQCVDTMEQAENLKRYMATKFFRFLVLLMKPTQDLPRRVYTRVPQQDLNERWDDARLYQKYGITTEESAFIDTLVKNVNW